MNIAVVGASNNAEKYGNRIVQHLRDDGHTVFPVNPKEDIILGLPVFRNVLEIDKSVDIVDIVVPAEVGIKVLEELANSGKNFDVWIQPGAESDELLEFLDEHSKDFGKVISRDCIMTSLDRHYTV